MDTGTHSPKSQDVVSACRFLTPEIAAESFVHMSALDESKGTWWAVVNLPGESSRLLYRGASREECELACNAARVAIGHTLTFERRRCAAVAVAVSRANARTYERESFFTSANAAAATGADIEHAIVHGALASSSPSPTPAGSPTTSPDDCQPASSFTGEMVLGRAFRHLLNRADCKQGTPEFSAICVLSRLGSLVRSATTPMLALVLLLMVGCGYNGTDPVQSTGHSNGRWVNKTSAADETFFKFMDLKLVEAVEEIHKPQVLADGKTPARPFTAAELQCFDSALQKGGKAEPRNWSIRGLESVPAAEMDAYCANHTCDLKKWTDPTPFIRCHTGGYCYAYLNDGEISIPDAYLSFVGPWELDNKLIEVCDAEIGPR